RQHVPRCQPDDELALDRCRCTHTHDQTVIRSPREFGKGTFSVTGDGQINRKYLHAERGCCRADHRPLSETDGRPQSRTTPTLVTRGTISLSSSSHLALRPYSN